MSGNSETVEEIAQADWVKLSSKVEIIAESESHFIDRMQEIHRLRLLAEPSAILSNALAESGVNVHRGPVLANGRIELLNYLREVSISCDYHRYGNLGVREDEERTPIL